MIVVVFNQNLKLDSFKKYQYFKENKDKMIFITTHFLFENEKNYLNELFSNVEFYTFADFLNDSEMSNVDEKSFTSNDMDFQVYLNNIKKRKNKLIIKKVLERFKTKNRYIFCTGLGIDENIWKKSKFKHLDGDYYYDEKRDVKFEFKTFLKKFKILRYIHNLVKKEKKYIHIPEEVFVGYIDNRKYIFLGNLNRIGYRLDIDFKPSKEECEKINQGEFETGDTCTYMTTWHEHSKCDVPDNSKYCVRWCQDGYLPPNYSHKDYFFKPGNVVYYCWDELGTNLFKNQGLPYELIPFRKKILLPKPIFPKNVKNVLVVASGSGDWTALKNRSDDDIIVDAIAQISKKYPNINFTYRCHPTWVHPKNVGVNSINRVGEYFEWLKLPNLKLSSNIPSMKNGKKYQYSFSRNSLDEDLSNADLVIGEHSISMIDGAFKKKPFVSVNLTKRRNFFVGINNLGFPSCTSIEQIEKIINSVSNDKFQKQYLKAINNYNNMTKM